MTTLHALLRTILADPLAASRAEPAPIAFVGFDMPLDLLLCGTRHFSHLPWSSGRPTPFADRWLESSFPGWARSMVQDWFDGAFDHFESVVFTRGDDPAQRLYYYLCELQRRGVIEGPLPLILDVAQIQRESSIVHSCKALHRLLDQLDIAHEALDIGRQHANAQRELFAQIDSNRSAPGHFYEHLARASLFVDLGAKLPQIDLTGTRCERRVLLAGSSPPDDRLHLAVEAAGWNVAGDSYHRGLRRHGAPIATDCDALTAVARHVNCNPYGPRAFRDRTSMLMDDMKRISADAVVLWLTNEDEALAWNVAQQRQALTKSGIPALVLTRQRWDGSDGAESAVQDFLRELAK